MPLKEFTGKTSESYYTRMRERDSLSSLIVRSISPFICCFRKSFRIASVRSDDFISCSITAPLPMRSDVPTRISDSPVFMFFNDGV